MYGIDFVLHVELASLIACRCTSRSKFVIASGRFFVLRSHQAEFTELLLLHDFCRSATHHTLLLFYSLTGTVLSPYPTDHTCVRIYYRTH